MSDNGSSALNESIRSTYLGRPRGPGERASSVPAHRDEHPAVTKPVQWDPWAASLPPSRDLSAAHRVDEPLPTFISGSSGLPFGSSPSPPLRRSYDNDSWTSSDLRGQTWSDVVPTLAHDDNSLSPSKRRTDPPRSTSPFHSLQETRHRQAAAAQAAALGHASDPNSIEEASRALADSALGDRTRGRSMDIDDFSRPANVDVFQQRPNQRNPIAFETTDNTGRGMRANILGSLEDDYSRKHPVARTRVQTLDPSFTLEPLQRANSTPPYSGPLPSSRDLPQSGLNPYPQSRTPQLQSSGHFTTSARDDPLSANFANLNLDSRPGEMGPGRKVANNILASNVGAGYPSEYRRPSPQMFDEYDTFQDEYNNQWQNPSQRNISPNEFDNERRPSPFYNTAAQVPQQRPQIQQPATDFQNAPVYGRDPMRQPIHTLPQARMNPIHMAHPGPLQHHPVIVRDQFYRPQFQTQQFPEFANGFQPPYSPTTPFIGHPAMQHMAPPVRRHEDTIRNMRSPLLEEFRAAKNRKFELKDILGHIVEFSGDQHGSRFIQQKLEIATVAEKQAVFEEVVPHSLQLMTDVFGNYVIQKFFEYGSQVQKTTLAMQMQGQILRLSLQMYGCRVVQKALEYITPEQQASLIKELDGNTLRCVKDQNGNHVVQKAIERVASDQIQFIVDSFRGQVAVIASHPYGCRVIQRVLEHCTEEQQKPVLEELHRAAQVLIKDQYGNYVIQHVIERGKPEDREKIIAGVFGQVLELSKHKFASNVVEKCVAYGTYQDRQRIIDEITEVHPDNSSPLLAMMKDGFGNYVIQKLLDVTEGEQRAQLVAKVKPQLLALKRYTYGKHLASIERLLVLSESRASTPGNTGNLSRPSTDRPAPAGIPNQMNLTRPELHVVPATPVDLNSPLHRPQ